MFLPLLLTQSALKMEIEVEFKDGTFYILSEEYNSFPEYQKCEHYKNTYIEGDSK